MMAYQVRNRKNPGGKSYELSYGRGKKKLTETMTKTPDGWVCPVGTFAKMKDCKEAWGEWAAATYEGTETPPMDAPTPVPVPVSMSGPPKYAPKAQALDAPQVVADPFNPLLKYPSDFPDKLRAKRLTPLGVLTEIRGWCDRYEDRIADVNHALALRGGVGFNPFESLQASVEDCLARELPSKETNAQDSPTRPA